MWQSFTEMAQKDFMLQVTECATQQLLQNFVNQLNLTSQKFANVLPVSRELHLWKLHCITQLTEGNWFDERENWRHFEGKLSPSLPLPHSSKHCCEALAFEFPQTLLRVEEAANALTEISSHDNVKGCVGALDGLLVKIRTPACKKVGHVKAFHSGHCGAHSVNVQAICDSNCKFAAVCNSSWKNQ